MNAVLFAADPAPLSAKLIGACLAGLLIGIVSGRLRTDVNTVAAPYFVACIAATACLHQAVDVEPGVLAILLGLVVGFIVFVLMPSKKTSVLAATAITLVAIAALGLLTFLRMPPAEMRQAIAHIRRCGGTVQQSDNPGITYRDQWWVSFEGHTIDDDLLLDIAPDLRKLPKVWLTLSACPVGDRGLSGLEHAANLEWFDLDRTKVTDAGLARLSDLNHLERLDLSGTCISDKGLSSLSNLASLDTLLLRHTAVTDHGVQKLRKSLHKCNIIYKENNE
jgi:hypothetical protein